jgi:NitT/TauT family transport system ATP-binding protein/sulfonate transport system ATP-binding protein
MPSEPARSVRPVKDKLVVSDIRKSYSSRNGTLEVVGGISLDVPDGGTVAIVGPSGCGKSTLMRILAGFEQPDSGSVLVDGAPRRGANKDGILISQQGSVFPWLTVRQNLMFGLDQGSEQERAALADRYSALVGLKGFENSYPYELSGGMSKRVELARALAVKPAVLFMDEPFSALDALMSLRIRTELVRILEEERHTVVLITHDVEEAIHLADRIFVLSPRPATIQRVFEVPLPHPRRVSTPEAQSLKEAILQELRL